MAANRRLSAIMLTDMVGFAALTQRDEALALRLLEEHRGIVRPLLGEFHGREVKTMGDGFLAEFESALSATQCAVEIQRHFEERNRSAVGDRIQLRIGLHVGDVVHEGGDVLGDAVNIASRLEPLAEPGGVVVSGAVFEQIRGKSGVELSPMPTPALKHIAFPVPVFRVELPWRGAGVGGIGQMTPWTDRETQANAVRQALDGAQRGEPRFLVLQGEAGIGKSRLAEELLREAEQRGFRVLTTRAFRGDEGTPYGPWVRLLRALARDAPLDLLRQAFGASADEVAKLVPEVRDRLGPIPAAADLDPEAGKRRFLEGVSQTFLNLSTAKPLVVFVDDLQWADPASVKLLEVLVRQFASQRLLLLAAHRESDPNEVPGLAALLVDLRRERRLELVGLRRFSPEEFHLLLGAMLRPSTITPDAERLLFERSGGNPFFAEELVRKLVADGAVVLLEGRWSLRAGRDLRLPDSIRTVLRERLQGLDPPTLQLLRTASAAGPSFSAELLQAVAGLDDGTFLTAIERAYQRRILEERRVGAGRTELVFADPQIEQALHEELPPVLRHRLHRKVAETLEMLEPEGQTRRAAELARHYLEANDPAKALAYVRRAAENAEALFAREEARRHYETALELLNDRPDEKARAEVLEALGSQLEALGQPRDALHRWTEAARLQRKVGNIKAAANLERRQGYAQRQYLQDSAAALTALEAARTTLEPLGETVELASVYGDLADLYWYDRKSADARRMCEQALGVASRTGAHDTEAWAYLILASLAPPDRWQELFDYLGRMLRIGQEHHLPDVVFGAYHNLAAATFYVKGDHQGALRLIDDGATEARAAQSKAGEMLLKARLAPIFLREAGELDRAEATAQSMLDYVSMFSPRPEPLSLLVLAQVALDRGDLDRSRTMASRALEVLRVSPDWSIQNLADAVMGEVQLELGDASGAAAAVAASYLGTRQMRHSAWGAASFCRLALLLGAALLQGAERPAGVPDSQNVAEEVGQIVGTLPRGPATAYAAELRSLLAEEAGNLDQALHELETAVDVWTLVGWLPEQARLLSSLASLRKAAGRAAGADDAERRAAELFSRMGSRRAGRSPAVPGAGQHLP